MAIAPRQMQLTPQQQADLASLAYELGHNPKTRSGLARLVKEISPERAKRSFSDVEQRETLEEFETRIEEKLDLKGVKAAKAEQDKQKTELAERYSPEQITEIESTMTRYGISDWKAGAVLYANDHPESDPTLRPPAHSERPGTTWEFPTTRGRDGKEMAFKDFAADPRTHSLNAAYNIITDFKNKNLSPALRR